MILHGNEGCPTMHCRRHLKLYELPGEHGGSAEIQDLSCFYDVLQCFHRFFNRNLCMPRHAVGMSVDDQLEEVHLGVQDNGVGMSDAVLAEIFSLFYSSKGSQGTGLGLAVSEKILHEHGGAIHVESAPEEGSRFLICWPYEPVGSG